MSGANHNLNFRIPTAGLFQMKVSTILRLVLATIGGTLLAYAITRDSLPISEVMAIFLIGFLPGLISGSWWSVPIAPLTLVSGVELWQRTHPCENCRPSEGGIPLLFTLLFLLVVVIGAPALSAALGVVCSKLIPSYLDPVAENFVADRPDIVLGVAIPIILLLIGFPLHVLGVFHLTNLMILAVCLLTVGFVAGASLLGWQSIGYAALLGLPPPFLMALISFLYAPLIDVAVTMLLWAVLPAMVGAVIGVVVSRFASSQRDPSVGAG